jgi:hypothetical protein
MSHTRRPNLVSAVPFFAAALPVLLLTVSAGVANAGTLTLYATTFNEKQLLQINIATGAGTLVGVIGETTGTADLASYGGNLYALDQGGAKFDLINPATAGIISSTTLGASIQGEGGFTFDNSGHAWVSNSQGSTGQLLECNVAINSGCTLISSLNPSMDGLAVSAAGVLYGLSQAPVGDAQPSLYTINETTGVATLIGSSGQTGINVGGLAFDPATGVFYAAFNGELYTINTTTGAATAVGAIGFGDISGLAFLGGTSVPEPGTASALALGVLILASGAILRRKASRAKY